jgi:hypothetical protein
MSPAEILLRLRRFLLVLSVLLFCGALIELWLVNHTEDIIQWLPFVLCAVGSLAALWVLFRPGRASVRVLRVCMVVVALGSLFGIYEHVEGNIGFAREIKPNSPTFQLVMSGLGGGNPLLAPGILALAATLALSATYRDTISQQ